MGSAGDQQQTFNFGGMDDGLGVGVAAQIVEDARLVLVAQQAVHAAAAPIGIHQHHAQAAAGQQPRQIDGDGGFAFAGRGAGEEEGLRPVFAKGGQQQGGAQMAVGFHVGRAGVAAFQARRTAVSPGAL